MRILNFNLLIEIALIIFDPFYSNTAFGKMHYNMGIDIKALKSKVKYYNKW